MLWLLPVVPLALFVVHAMMLFAMSWLATAPRRAKRRLTAVELRAKLAAQGGPERAWWLEPASNRDFNARWQVVDDEWRQQFDRVCLDSIYSLRFLLDEERHEVRQQESIRSTYFFAGREGLKWRFRFAMSYFAGPMGGRWTGRAYGISRLWPPTISETRRFDIDIGEAKRDARRAARAAGWEMKPVIWWFEASRWGLRLGRLLIPPPLNRLSPRALWGTLYPASYVTLIAYLVVIANIRSAGDIGVIAMVSAAWWGVSGGLIALIAYVQRPRKRRKARRAR